MCFARLPKLVIAFLNEDSLILVIVIESLGLIEIIALGGITSLFTPGSKEIFYCKISGIMPKFVKLMKIAEKKKSTTLKCLPLERKPVRYNPTNGLILIIV